MKDIRDYDLGELEAIVQPQSIESPSLKAQARTEIRRRYQGLIRWNAAAAQLNAQERRR